jgi:hypothetical protein
VQQHGACVIVPDLQFVKRIGVTPLRRSLLVSFGKKYPGGAMQRAAACANAGWRLPDDCLHSRETADRDKFFCPWRGWMIGFEARFCRRGKKRRAKVRSAGTDRRCLRFR